MAKHQFPFRLAAVLIAAPLLLAASPRESLEHAIDRQRELVAGRPGSAGALNDLGNLLVETGQLAEAEEAYRRAMDLEPGRPEPPFNLALLLTARKQPREARGLLRSLLKKHPDHAWAHYQLGTLRQARGQRRRALRSYTEAFRLDSSLTDPRYNPHVLDNPLATAAMLQAFAGAARATGAQPIYTDPARISGLLLPPLTAEPTAPREEEPPPEKPMETEEVTAGPGG